MENQYRTWERDAGAASLAPSQNRLQWASVNTRGGAEETGAEEVGATGEEEVAVGTGAEVASTSGAVQSLSSQSHVAQSQPSQPEVQAVHSLLPQQTEVQAEVTGTQATVEAASVAGQGGIDRLVTENAAAQQVTSGAANGEAGPDHSLGAQLTAARADLQQDANRLSRDFRYEARMQLEAVKAEAERAVAMAAARVAELQEAVRILVAYDV